MNLPADHPPAGDKAGHSVAGEAFDEGPRQAAVLLPGVAGHCQFPVTTGSEEAQRFFDQGVVQLHGFWFLEAERSFRQVLRLDPECTMAWWGMAMANVENPKRARLIMADGMKKRRDHLTPKESAWLQSLSDFYEERKGGGDEKARLRNLVRDWEQIVGDHPDDIEAKAFLIGRIWRNDAYGGLKISSHLSVDALAREVLARAPQHPGIHHYRIHLWNHEKDQRALDSADALGASAPGIAHNWHMPGHTFSAMHRYAEAAWHMEASARVDHAHMARFRVLPDEVFNYAHNNGWLVENHVFQGRAGEAVALAKNLIELPRIPRGKPGGNVASQDWARDGSSFAEGRRRLLWTLSTLELWPEVTALAGTPYLASVGDEREDLEIGRLLGLAAFRTGDTLGGLRRMVALHERENDLQKQRDAAVADAEKKNREANKSADEISKARESAAQTFADRLTRVREAVGELALAEKLAAGDGAGARSRLRELGGVPDGRLASYHTAVGDWERALDVARRFAESSPGQWMPARRFADLLDQVIAKARTGAWDAWDGWDQQAHEKELAATREKVDAAQKPAELANRPALDSLGPAHWSPVAAPAWTLLDLDGNARSSTEFSGRSYVLVFFLGRECTHCMEQLNTLAPHAAAFAAAGLPLLAVSLDSPEGLKQTLAKDGASFPFPLFSNNGLETFRTFRAYDDFEDQPLHGVFVIDSQGMVRWQHISFEPFMKPEFLLQEAQRLLTLPKIPAAVAGG
ncbi:MAG: peroxiredoxin family protein [Verrucomicrobiales bacterium]